MRVGFIPVFQSLNRRDVPQGFLGNVLIIHLGVAGERLLQVLGAVKPGRGEDFADTPAEAYYYRHDD